MTAAAVLDRPADLVSNVQGGGDVVRRSTSTQQLSIEARCRDCDWQATTANALAIAARHTDTHGHQTITVMTTEVVYGDGGSVPGGSAQTAIAIPGLTS